VDLEAYLRPPEGWRAQGERLEAGRIPAAVVFRALSPVVGPEDVLEIKVWSNDDLNRTVELSTEGAFTFPLIGKVQGGGLTVFELERQLREKLAAGYLNAPQVNVTVVKYKSQKVSVLGEVKRPGSYFIKGKTHILVLISEAEGLTDKAGRTVTIVRAQQSAKAGAAPVTIDLEEVKQGSTDARLFVDNGDSIYIAEAPRIYVAGEVARPGEYRWRKDLTLEQALSLAGGLKDSAGRGLKIVRPKTPPGFQPTNTADANVESTTIPVDLDDLKEGDAGYLVLDGDSIFVAEAPWVYVNGEVMRPGRFKWEKRMTVDVALSLAGGPTKRAAVARTEIMRVAGDGVEKIRIPMDAPVMPGDIIKVPESYL